MTGYVLIGGSLAAAAGVVWVGFRLARAWSAKVVRKCHDAEIAIARISGR